MATISISQLDTATQAKVDDLYEVAVVDENSQTGYASRKLTAAQIATLIAQGVQFSGLSTEAKNIIAAINEAAQNGGTEVEANPVGEPTDTLETIGIDGTIYGVSGSGEPVSKTVTGNPIHIEDASDAPIVSGKVTFAPKQDLHGYDKPWAGGAGKNLFDGTILNGVYTDADFTVGGSSPNIQKSIKIYLKAGDYTISFVPTTSGTTYRIMRRLIDGGYVTNPVTNITNYSFSVAEDGYVGLSFRREDNDLWDNANIQIESGSTATTFEPYSNICPIEGYTDCELEVTGKNKVNIMNADKQGTASAITLTASTDSLRIQVDGSIYSGAHVEISSIANGTYYLSADYSIASGLACIQAFDSSNNKIYDSGQKTTNGSISDASLTVSDGYLKIIMFASWNDGSGDVTYSNVMLATQSGLPYSPYADKTYTIDLDGTRYGGTVNVVSGVMTVNRACFIGDGSSDENWNITGTGRLQLSDISNLKQYTDINNEYLTCSIAVKATSTAKTGVITYSSGKLVLYLEGFKDGTLEDWKTYISSNPVYICYELATPLTFQLTPEQIRTLEGTNNISTNMTTMSLEYITQDYQSLVKLIERSAGHHYSTQERVVGTWIDGKPLYEKSFVISSISTSNTDLIDITNLSVDKVIEIKGFIDGTEISYTITTYDSSSSQATIFVKRDSGNVVIRGRAVFGAGSFNTGGITIQYTKTTD